MRSVKDGQRMAEVWQETASDSIMSSVGAYVHNYTHKHQYTQTHNLEVLAQFNNKRD